MFRVSSIICLLIFSLLDAGEVSLYNFQGCPGDYIAIQNLQVGRVKDDCLSELGVRIEVTQLDRAAGTISINVSDKAKKITSVDLKAIPSDKTSKVISVIGNTIVGFPGTTATKFESNGDLGPESYLQVYLKDETSASQSAFGQNFSVGLKPGPNVSLLVKGKEIPGVTRYRIALKEARENTGLDLKISKGWTGINRQFMWIGEGFGKSRPEDEIKVDFMLEVPSRSATKIERISGDLIMSIDQTHNISVDLALGKLEHPELAKYGVVIDVTKLENNKLELTYSSTKDKLFSIALDPRGQKFKNLSQTTRAEGEISTLTCSTDLPLNKNTGLALTLIDSNREIRVPFELKDLSLVKEEKPSIGMF